MNNQCVPSWDLDNDGPPFAPPTQTLLLHHNNRLPYAAEDEVAELTWKDGNLALLGLRHPPRIGKPIPRYPSPAVDAAGGTLECIVDQARGASSSPDPLSWVGGVRHPAFVDALVPCANQGSGRKRTRDGGRDCASKGSTTPKKLVALAASVRNGAGTLVTADACEQTEAKRADKNGYSTTPSASRTSAEDHVEGGASPETENESIAGTRSLAVDDRNSVSHSLRYQRDALGEIGTTSISTKRSRVAAIHNLSERKRRDRINQKMKTLQKLLPNSSKTDKASMLDEVIEYLKLLQAQVHMMSRMSTISHHHLQIYMMTQLARMSHMSMGLGLMDPNMLGRPGSFGMPPPSPSPPSPPQMLHPSAFFPLHPPSAAGAWDASGTDWIQQPGGRAFPDMFSAFMGCPTQQQAMGTETYNRMAGIYQLLYGYNQK